MKNIPICCIILLSVFMFLISCHISVVVGIWMFICLKQNPVVCYPLIFQESPFWSPNSNGCHHKSQHVWKWKMASYFQGTFSISWALPVPLSHSRVPKSLALGGNNQLHSTDIQSSTPTRFHDIHLEWPYDSTRFPIVTVQHQWPTKTAKEL